jgi:hypothetical protein
VMRYVVWRLHGNKAPMYVRHSLVFMGEVLLARIAEHRNDGSNV